MILPFPHFFYEWKLTEVPIKPYASTYISFSGTCGCMHIHLILLEGTYMYMTATLEIVIALIHNVHKIHKYKSLNPKIYVIFLCTLHTKRWKLFFIAYNSPKYWNDELNAQCIFFSHILVAQTMQSHFRSSNLIYEQEILLFFAYVWVNLKGNTQSLELVSREMWTLPHFTLRPRGWRTHLCS